MSFSKVTYLNKYFNILAWWTEFGPFHHFNQHMEILCRKSFMRSIDLVMLHNY